MTSHTNSTPHPLFSLCHTKRTAEGTLPGLQVGSRLLGNAVCDCVTVLLSIMKLVACASPPLPLFPKLLAVHPYFLRTE